MTTLTIDKNSKPVQVLRPDNVRVVDISGTAASAGLPFDAGVRVARVVATTDCHYRVGSGTTAATLNNNFLPANTIEYIHIFSDDRISLITSGSTGKAYVTAMV